MSSMKICLKSAVVAYASLPAISLLFARAMLTPTAGLFRRPPALAATQIALSLPVIQALSQLDELRQ
jgi:hypothetical protein